MSRQSTKPTVKAIREAETVARNRAMLAGATVLTATPNRLFIDLDNVANHEQFVTGLEFLQEHLGHPSLQMRLSKSSNIHVVLEFEDIAFSYDDQIKWQLILGSDPERECWHAIRSALGIETNLLFQPRSAAIYKTVPIMLWCRKCMRLSVLSRQNYMDQLSASGRTWQCLKCGEDRCGVIE